MLDALSCVPSDASRASIPALGLFVQHLYLAFSPTGGLYEWTDLKGKHVRVQVSNMRDMVGNNLADGSILQDRVGVIQWKFDVEDFDPKLTASQLSIRLVDWKIEQYYDDPEGFKNNFTQKVKAKVGPDVNVAIKGVSAGSIIVDFELYPNGLAAGVALVNSSLGLGQTIVQDSKLVALTDSALASGSAACDGCHTTTTLVGAGVGIGAGLLLLVCLLSCCVRKLLRRKPLFHFMVRFNVEMGTLGSRPPGEEPKVYLPQVSPKKKQESPSRLGASARSGDELPADDVQAPQTNQTV